MGVMPLFLNYLQALKPSWINDFPHKLGHGVEMVYRPVPNEETRVNLLTLEKDTEG